MKTLKIVLLFFTVSIQVIAQEYIIPNYMQAGKAFQSGDYGKAISIARSISNGDPSFENAQLLIGYCYLKLDSLEIAEDTFMEVINKNHLSSQAFNGLGLVHYKRISDEKMVVRLLKNIFSTSDESKAEQMFLRAIKYNERYPEARFNLTRLYLRMKDEIKHISAENIISVLVKEYPENKEYKLLQGQVKSKLGKFKEAKNILQSVVKNFPEDQKAQLELAFSEFKLKEYDKFSEHFLSGIKNLNDANLLLIIFQDIYDILSKKEIEFIKDLGVDGSYYYNFWQKRDPNLVTDINERLVIHYQRLEYARDIYGADTFTGYDDRGMIYIRYGNPDQKYIGASININVIDNESWVYKIMDKTVTFDFVQKGATYSLIGDLSEVLQPGFGTNVLSTLQRVYEERSHLDGPYMRMVNELDNIEVSRQHDTKIENIAPFLVRSKIAKEKALREIPKSTFNYDIGGKDLPFSFNYAYFYDKSQIRLELYFGIKRSDINANFNSTNDPMPAINQMLKIVNDKYETILQNKSEIDLNINPLGEDLFITQTNTFLNCYSMKLNVELECDKTNQRRLINLPINIDEFDKEKLNVSSIQFSKLIQRYEANEDTTFIKNGLMIEPYPFTTISKSNLIFLYFEIYNLSLDKFGMGEYEINLKIYRDIDSMDFSDLLQAINPFSSSENESIETSFNRNTNNPMVPEYFALDFNALNVGRYRLIVGITDKQSKFSINRRVLFDIID